MAATSAEPVSSQCKYEWAKNTVAETENYALLQININGILYPVVPILADEKAICIGLPSGLCVWLEQRARTNRWQNALSLKAVSDISVWPADALC